MVLACQPRVCANRRVLTSGWSFSRFSYADVLSLTPGCWTKDHGMNADELLDRYEAGERDFSGVFLAGVNLSGVDLRGIMLQKANLRFANLRDAILADADLSEADLYEANLRGTVLRNTNLTGTVLWLAETLGAHLEHANLQDAKVASAQLSRAASLAGAVMPDGAKHL
jgi:uncharacterized protein YjbI with pentapeptide repeats